MTSKPSDRSSPDARRYRRAFYVLAPVLAILLVVMLVEAVLALVYPVPHAGERNMAYVADPVLGYRNLPGGKGSYRGGIVANANALGHRDDPVTLEKPPGVYRVLVLGDSFTVGASVEQDQAWPQVLERLLNEAAGPPVEVVNAAVGGWEPLQYLLYFENEGAGFDADLVIVGFFVGNDLFDRSKSADAFLTAVGGRRVRREAAAWPFIHARVWLYEHSHLARLLLRPADWHDRPRRRRGCDDFSRARLEYQKSIRDNHLGDAPSQRQRAAAGLEQIRALEAAVTASGAAFLLLVIPDQVQVTPALQNAVLEGVDAGQYDFHMPQRFLREAWSELDVVDVLEDFRADPRCLYLNDTHWTSEGHALAAGIVARHLRP